MEIFVATTNEGKLAEIRKILKNYKIMSLADIETNIDIEENGETFEENAIKKATTIYNKIKIPTIADDSGIEIEKLNNWPGVYTARFLGKDKSGNEYARERNEYILEKMKNIPKEKRKVKHITCIAYCDEKGIKVVRGEQIGYIATSPKGSNGFGFDEIFELANGKTMAEISKEEKNKISSRKSALEKLKQKLI